MGLLSDMRFQHVAIDAFSYSLPPHVVTSDEIEQRLSPVYDRLGLPEGRLELMTGIRERRFFDHGTRPGEISAQTAARAIELSGIPHRHIGALIHGSVCRDQMEPATAASVHHALKLPDSAMILDVSNACLGLLSGMLIVANMIELGQIRAGVVVGTETGRSLVEGTIDALLANESLTRNDVKSAFASLTIGSGSAAVVLADRKLSRTGNRLLGGALMSDTTSHQLCAGGVEQSQNGDNRPLMQTDSEALLRAGIGLASRTWSQAKRQLGWTNDSVDKCVTHQVGRAHRKAMLDSLELDVALDFPTVEFLGNTGAVALPMTAGLGISRGHLATGDRVALLGIGSGLNSVMLGMEWAGGSR